MKKKRILLLIHEELIGINNTLQRIADTLEPVIEDNLMFEGSLEPDGQFTAESPPPEETVYGGEPLYPDLVRLEPDVLPERDPNDDI